MLSWVTGFTERELLEAQERYSIVFPPDLFALLLERNLALGYQWNREDPNIREMLAWPFEMLWFDIEHGSWWPDWGPRPTDLQECKSILRTALDAAPRLIPIYGHRFLPETPHEAGNPVFSMHGFDTIYYGNNLENYLKKEDDNRKFQVSYPMRYIPFWSDLVERYSELEFENIIPN